MNKPLTVMYLDHTAKLSGGEIALARLLGAMDTTQVHPVVVLGEDGPLVGRLRGCGIETLVEPLDAGVRNTRKDTLGVSSVARVGRVAKTLAYSVRIARRARTLDADIIHTNSLKADIYGGVAGLLARRPVIWHVRDSIDAGYLPKSVAKVFRWLARWMPTYVVANSESTLQRLYRSPRQGGAVVPRGISAGTGVIHDGLSAHGERVLRTNGEGWRSPVRIGIVGRISRWKGQHVFLEAAADVLKAGYDARFLIVGSPLFGEEAYQQELQGLAERLGIGSHVDFLGFQPDVRAVMQDMDILVHASTIPEPFGQVVIEGMVEGLPVIATNGGGVREIVTHGENGLLVEMGDAEGLARELCRLLRDPAFASRLGCAGREHVLRNFTAEKLAERMVDVYHRVACRTQVSRRHRL